jgi:phospholipid/cholesterol/gamma-HCH transport system ATP-binding protein
MTETRNATRGHPTNDEPIIVVRGLAKQFGGRYVLKDVNLDVHPGETVVVMGASGCGKSTLLRCLIGAYTPDAGSIHLFGQEIAGLDESALNQVRRRFGILFQGGALYQSMTVGENVALALREHSDLDDRIIRLIVKMKLELVGLRDFEDLMPSEISGGMAKRVALARAIALDPEVLFYDEPTTGLDPILAGVINTLINDLKRTLNVASIVVTHDMNSAFDVADRMIMLHEGRVVKSGDPAEFRQTDDPLVRQFVDGLADGPVPLRMAKTDSIEDLMGTLPIDEPTLWRSRKP